MNYQKKYEVRKRTETLEYDGDEKKKQQNTLSHVAKISKW